MNLPSRLLPAMRTVSTAVLKSPHTLLCLPRRHTRTFWRSLIALGGMTLVYLGAQEARLRATCSGPEDITADELAARTDSPVWARVCGVAPRAEIAVESSEGGSFKGIWLPLVSRTDPGTVIAVLRAPDRATAAALQSTGDVVVEGLAYFPRPVEHKNLGVYLHWLNRPAAGNLRVLEIGRTPSGWFLVAVYLLAGLGVVAYAFRARLQSPAFAAGEGEESAPEMVVTLNDYQSEPLPEVVKVEVSHMLDGVWGEVERQS